MTELATLPNPFRVNVVQDAWQAPSDVAEIHRDAFEACLAVIDSASKNVPDSLLIYGAAGSGKTHLLTRLQRHLAKTSREAPDRVLRCLFVFVRLQTSPQLLWQHVRKRLAEDLMRRDEGVTQLQRLLAHQIGTHRGSSPGLVVRELRVLGREGRDSLAAYFESVAANLRLPRDLLVVLDHLMYDGAVRDASAWLAGESLPDSVLGALGVGAEPEDREEASREIVTALCRLAGSTLPVVFCFDQVEALQHAGDDRNALFRFARMAADLHDADENVCVITCLQVALDEMFRKAVRTADLDRIAKRRATLEQLDRSQVEKLVRLRLDEVAELRELRSRHADQPFYPLTSKFVEDLTLESPCVPRRVLSACARAFEETQHGLAPRAPETAEFLAQELDARSRDATRTAEPSDTTRIVLHGIEALGAVREMRVREDAPGLTDVVIESGKRAVALSLRNEVDGRSLGPKLKRLLGTLPRADGAKLVIVRDPRHPISKDAKKTRETLAELQAKGAIVVEPSLAALAALDALASLLSDAKSGDLANDGDAVAEGTVLAWLRKMRRELSLEPVNELLDAMWDESIAPIDAEHQDLATLLARERVVELERAARSTSHSSERLLAAARRRPDHFLVLDGPPVVLVDVAGIGAEVE
jgi:hypothetical protein